MARVRGETAAVVLVKDLHLVPMRFKGGQQIPANQDGVTHLFISLLYLLPRSLTLTINSLQKRNQQRQKLPCIKLAAFVCALFWLSICLFVHFSGAFACLCISVEHLFVHFSSAFSCSFQLSICVCIISVEHLLCISVQNFFVHFSCAFQLSICLCISVQQHFCTLRLTVRTGTCNCRPKRPHGLVCHRPHQRDGREACTTARNLHRHPQSYKNRMQLQKCTKMLKAQMPNAKYKTAKCTNAQMHKCTNANCQMTRTTSDWEPFRSGFWDRTEQSQQ